MQVLGAQHIYLWDTSLYIKVNQIWPKDKIYKLKMKEIACDKM